MEFTSIRLLSARRRVIIKDFRSHLESMGYTGYQFGRLGISEVFLPGSLPKRAANKPQGSVAEIVRDLKLQNSTLTFAAVLRMHNCIGFEIEQYQFRSGVSRLIILKARDHLAEKFSAPPSPYNNQAWMSEHKLLIPRGAGKRE